MTPNELKRYLTQLVQKQLQTSTMIWGAPGIGKSSIVAQVSRENQLDCIDLRLSQLAPTDLRGLPVAVEGLSTWYPPEFLPREGAGILFLDEVNMAPPAMQGMAQQLILDRKVGSYSVPEGWFVWAAGNRKEDRAAVFDMPAPLANRFLHLSVEVDFESFKSYGIAAEIHEQILAFLSFRPTLLHKLDPRQPAWPSPRSWVMASELHYCQLNVAPAIGDEATAEFMAYLDVYESLPELAPILAGKGKAIAFPKEPSVRYATTIGLALRSDDAKKGYNSFKWLSSAASAEWVQLFAVDLFRNLKQKKQLGALAQLVQKDPSLKALLKDFQGLVTV
ncbi:MAG: MoxR family ATPase [Spirulina sp. SIO3F2]|nr:MoxR family ATPase [Spirulina sp. SIO3F2]